MVDTLQTAAEDAVSVGATRMSNPFADEATFDSMLEDWRAVTGVVNDLNRSLGLDDAYPFGMSRGTVVKLRYICRLVGD